MGKEMNVIFTGDLCVSGTFAKRLERGEALFSSEIEDLLRQQDVCIGNLEGPLVDPDLQETYQAKIINPPACLTYLTACNIQVFTLANNHSFDCGKEGFLRTRNQLLEAKAKWFGAGETWGEASKPLILSQNDHRTAFLGISFREGMIAGPKRAGVFFSHNLSMISALIQQARKTADTVIICYHGEEEYTRFPMPARRQWLHKLAQMDVDAIVCHHPHVVQGIEYVNGIPICYSLGNTIFDVPGHRQRSFTNLGGLLQMQIEPGNLHLKFIPLYLDRDAGKVYLLQSASMMADLAHIHDFSQYDQQWREEAYRVFQERHLNSAVPLGPSSPSTKPASSSPWIKKLLRFSFYKTLFATLRYRNSRAIFVAAMIYRLKKRFHSP